MNNHVTNHSSIKLLCIRDFTEVFVFTISVHTRNVRLATYLMVALCYSIVILSCATSVKDIHY